MAMSLNLDVSANRSLATQPDHSPEAAAQTGAVATPAAEPAHTGTTELGWNPQLSRVISTALAANAPVGPAQGPSFDSQVRGQDAKPIDMQLAQISQDVYNLGGSNVPGWTKLSDTELQQAGINPQSLDDPSTGFRAGVYKNDQGQVVVAFAGTDPKSGKDWLADGTQAAGLPTAQYDEAVALATQAKNAFGDNMVITGHSLGGGLASVASVATNSATVTFNAAGVNNQTLSRYVHDADPGTLKQQADNGLVRRYAVKGEILTGEQETGAARGFAPDAIGHKIELQPATHVPWGLELPGLNLISDSVQGGILHTMGSVIDALKQDQPWTPGAAPKEGIVDRIADGTGKVGNAIVGGIDTVKNGAKDVVGAVTDGAGDLLGHVPLIGGLLKGGAHVLGTVTKGALEIGGDLLDGAVGLGTHLVQGLEKFVGGAVTTVVDGAKKLGSLAIDGAKKVGSLVVDGAKAAGNFIVDGAKTVGNAVVGGAKAVGNAVVDGAKTVGNAVVDGAKSVGNAINKAMPWNW